MLNTEPALDRFKRASWLELFYDVAFVALVAQLTYLTAANHHSIEDFLNMFIIGYSIFIAWWATTANRNLQPNERGFDKLLVQLQMVGAFMMSLTMPGTFAGEYFWFFFTFGLVRVLQAMMIVSMYIRFPDKRPATYNLLEGLMIAALLWLLSGFMPAPWHFLVAGMALVIDILTPLTRGKGNTIRYLNVYHLQERLGLFLMLVIGESMIVVALSNTATSLSATEPAVIFSGLGLMIALWWLYFDHSDRYQGKRPRSLFLFIHAHGFLFGSLILLSVGYKLILEGADKAGLTFIYAGVVGIMITLGVIRAMLYRLVGRKLYIFAFLLILTAILGGIGWRQGMVIESMVLATIFFVVVALLDYKNFFERVSDKIKA